MATDSMSYRLVTGDTTSLTGQGYKDLVGDIEFQCSHLTADTRNLTGIRNQSKSKLGLRKLHQSKAACTLHQLNKEKLDVN